MSDIASLKLEPEDALPQGSMLALEVTQAIDDLVRADSTFQPVHAADNDNGPWHVTFGLREGQLGILVADGEGKTLPALLLSLKPYAKIVKDYLLMVESYEKAKAGNPYQLEAIDMGRRGIHDEGAALLRQRLIDKISLDQATARRFFTLICGLHLQGARHGGMLNR